MSHYWLVKSEPSCYSIDDLEKEGKTAWDGVRNFQARNFMRDQMQIGDPVLFYHSSTEPPAIVGLAKVSSLPYPDPSAFDPADDHFDPDSSPENPRWILVDISFVQKFKHPLSLDSLKANPLFDGMVLTKKGSRLSVQPVSAAHFELLCQLAS